MLRYSLAALALKTFSLNSSTRLLYRKIGNSYGAARRENARDLSVRIQRGDLLVELARKHHALQDGACLLEIGIFNGILFPAGTSVASEMKWNTYQFGYEWDFIYRDRGYFGVLVAAKYTDVELTLTSPVGLEYTQAKGPIPDIGAAGRIYVMSNVAITGQFLAFNLPNGLIERGEYEGEMYDVDIFATVNFVNSFGVLGGYRWIDVNYTADFDKGDLNLDGFYLGAVVRF